MVVPGNRNGVNKTYTSKTQREQTALKKSGIQTLSMRKDTSPKFIKLDLSLWSPRQVSFLTLKKKFVATVARLTLLCFPDWLLSIIRTIVLQSSSMSAKFEADCAHPSRLTVRSHDNDLCKHSTFANLTCLGIRMRPARTLLLCRNSRCPDQTHGSATIVERPKR